MFNYIIIAVGETEKAKIIEDNKNGKLESIDFFVDFKDGFSGGANQDNLTNQSHFGFYREYSRQAASPFGTGNLHQHGDT